MGCEISSGNFSINTTRASWMVVQMCSKWFDKERDTDSDGVYQNSVSNVAIKMADNEWPNDARNIYNKFLIDHFDFYKRHRAEVPTAQLCAFEQEFKRELVEAREFIAQVARTDEDASLSH